MQNAMKKSELKDNAQSVAARAEQIREEASYRATRRLARGNTRLRVGAFAPASVWEERMRSQSARVERLNRTLGEGNLPNN